MRISVILVSYNQEKYISKAIESILMQNIDVEYELIVCDDFSTDRTIEIVSEYSKKYPEIIKILPTDKNIGITKNYKRAFEVCKGDYIAVLEGDDLWTSPNKLQRQADFLDNHTECSLCFNDFLVKDEFSGNFRENPSASYLIGGKIFFAGQLASENFIGNFSACMYRRSVIENIDKSLYELKVYDWMFNIVCAQFGPIGYLNENMSIYRIHDGGTWSTKKNKDMNNELLNLIIDYDNFLEGRYHLEFTNYRKRINKYNSKKIIKLFIPKIVWVIIDLLIPKIFEVTFRYLKKKQINKAK